MYFIVGISHHRGSHSYVYSEIHPSTNKLSMGMVVLEKKKNKFLRFETTFYILVSVNLVVYDNSLMFGPLA